MTAYHNKAWDDAIQILFLWRRVLLLYLVMSSNRPRSSERQRQRISVIGVVLQEMSSSFRFCVTKYSFIHTEKQAKIDL